MGRASGTYWTNYRKIKNERKTKIFLVRTGVPQLHLDLLGKWAMLASGSTIQQVEWNCTPFDCTASQFSRLVVCGWIGCRESAMENSKFRSSWSSTEWLEPFICVFVWRTWADKQFTVISPNKLYIFKFSKHVTEQEARNSGLKKHGKALHSQ